MNTTWLPALPPGWDVRRLGSLGRFTKGNGGSKEDNRDGGYPVVRYGELYTRFGLTITAPQSFIDDEATGRYTPLPKGTVVFTASGEDPDEIGKAAVSLLESPAFAGGDTILFTPQTDEVDVKFLAYALDSRPLRSMKAVRSTGFTVVHINAGKLKTLPIPLPPSHVQRAIADFLDRETAQIDAFIAKSEQLITLLTERRGAVISRAVTGQLEVQGVDRSWHVDRVLWSGAPDVPQLAFRRLFAPLNRPVPADAQIVTAYTDGQVTLRSNRAKVGYHEAADLSGFQGVQVGDFVVHGLDIMRGSVGVSDSNGAISAVCTVCKPLGLIEPRYAALAIRVQAQSGLPKALARGVRDGGADFRRWATLAELPLPVPPMDYQRGVLQVVDELTTKIDRAVLSAEAGVALARERRVALISSAVTGQLEVAQ